VADVAGVSGGRVTCSRPYPPQEPATVATRLSELGTLRQRPAGAESRAGRPLPISLRYRSRSRT